MGPHRSIIAAVGIIKLRVARDRKSKKAGRRIEGRKPAKPEVIAAARRLARKPRKGKRPSLRTVAAGLAAMGHLGPSKRPYGPESVKRMLGR